MRATLITGICACYWVAVMRAEEPAVAEFKNHLTINPYFSKILYSELSCTDLPVRTFHAGYCRDSFFLRQLTGSENIDKPISEANRNRSPLYVGSIGDTRWQIAGYQLSISIRPNVIHPDRYATMSDGMQIFLGEVLNFGSQHVQPGTFVWTGNRFKAEPSDSARQQGLNTIQGEITVESGVVSSMLVQGSGWWQYKYLGSTNLPFGLPSEITQVAMNSDSNIVCIKKIRIHEMVPADPSKEMLTFDPKPRIDSKITILNIWSNSIEVVKPASNERVTAIVLKEAQGGKVSSERQQSAKWGIRLLLAFVAIGVPFIFLFRGFLRRNDIKTKKERNSL